MLTGLLLTLLHQPTHLPPDQLHARCDVRLAATASFHLSRCLRQQGCARQVYLPQHLRAMRLAKAALQVCALACRLAALIYNPTLNPRP